MATSTNVGVKDKGTNGKLTFDIPSSLQSGDCSFFFKTEGDQQQGIFQLKVKDELVRENVSLPFASGALKILKQKKKNDCYVVEIKKSKEVDLKNLFD
nr:hypothetical protein BgiMline_016215 [Biomphalaria glabrata]